ncbi:putative decarboxylase [Nitratireductor indicus C115]|uniref:Putative decarboxylase n=1 Tax=Nitratireductor indicus C115 TaxID=1231190 RepID=K2PHY1_9HYPH|nr:thiamine pyrophosphate-binding protein [Nitratireductor indicus]EKF40747.1 putative decarboxylase [Nitratireductor indicus C115]SFQ75814.1 sulfopyruvate decarboxylase, alpha subunit [Nitratireductor indicus]
MGANQKAEQEGWADIVVRILKRNDIDLITYVPDNVLRPLIDAVTDDPYFTVISPAREEEAVAIVAGAYMGGRKGVTLMQTSGFATIPNALASLACPFQLPIVMFISERGVIGEFQQGQAMVCRTMRPVLQSLGIEHFAIQDKSQVEFVVEGMIKQAFATQAPAAIILSPLLTKRPH